MNNIAIITIKKYYKINFLNQHGLCVKLVFGENF